MDRFNFVRDGGSRLPPGFRFEPTEEELVFQYLAPKVLSHSLPALVIPEIDDVCRYDPWDLPGEANQDKYFFSNMGGGGSSSCSGYWKAVGSAKRIACDEIVPIVGVRKSMVFYEGRRPRGVRTNWIIHQYCIAKKKTHQSSFVPIGNWTLCHIFLREGGKTTQDDDDGQDRDKPTNHRLIEVDASDTESSSSSSTHRQNYLSQHIL